MWRQIRKWLIEVLYPGCTIPSVQHGHRRASKRSQTKARIAMYCSQVVRCLSTRIIKDQSKDLVFHFYRFFSRYLDFVGIGEGRGGANTWSHTNQLESRWCWRTSCQIQRHPNRILMPLVRKSENVLLPGWDSNTWTDLDSRSMLLLIHPSIKPAHQLPRGQRAPRLVPSKSRSRGWSSPAFADMTKPWRRWCKQAHGIAWCNIVAQIQTRLPIPAHRSSQLVTFHRSTFLRHPSQNMPPKSSNTKASGFPPFRTFVAHLLFPAPLIFNVFLVEVSVMPWNRELSKAPCWHSPR